MHPILLVVPPFRYPPTTGGDVRTCNLIEILSRKYYVDCLVVSGNASTERLPHHPLVRNLFSFTLFSRGLYSVSRLRYKFFARIDRYILGLLPHSRPIHGGSLQHFIEMLQLCHEYIHHFHRYPYFLFAVPRRRSYLCIVDVDDSPHSSVRPDNSSRHAVSLRGAAMSFLLCLYERRMNKYLESLYAHRADSLLYVSRTQVLPAFSDKSKVLPNIAYLSSGACESAASNPSRSRITPILSSSTIVMGFIGSLGHPPNIHALTFFLRYVWPSLCDESRFSLIIAGSGQMPEGLSLLVEHSVGVEFVGFVPNLADFFSCIDFLIAPITWGAGSNVKVVESLAWGVPVAGSEFAIASAREIGLSFFIESLNSASEWIDFLRSPSRIDSFVSLRGSVSGLNAMRTIWESVLLNAT